MNERILHLETKLKEKEELPKVQDKVQSIPTVLVTEAQFTEVRNGVKISQEKQKTPGIQLIDTVFGKVHLCNKCEDIFKTEAELKEHIEAKHTKATSQSESKDEMVCHLRCEDGQCQCDKHFSCTLCTEKFKDHPSLLKHRKEKHTTDRKCRHGIECRDQQTTCRFNHEDNMEVAEVLEEEEQMDVGVQEQETRETQDRQHKCYNCETRFSDRGSLIRHIGNNHKTYQPCNNFANGTCEYDDDCRFQHIIAGVNDFICFKCGFTATSKTLLMRHIKEIHKANTPCTKFRKNECRFSSSACIFNHEVDIQEPRATESQTTPLTSTPAVLDFRQAVLSSEPPEHTQMKSKLLSLFTMMLDQVPAQVLPQILNQLQK